MTARTHSDAARIALACLDLTSLNDGDTDADVVALCERASGPHGAVAAVCVWPRFARLARDRVSPPSRWRRSPTSRRARPTWRAPSATSAPSCKPVPQEVDVVLPYRALLAGDEPSRASRCCAPRVAAARA